MAKKEATYQGKTLEELQALSITELMPLFPARQRRSLKRGLTDQEKKLLKKIKANEQNIETHCKDLIILPSMVGATVKIHSGKEYLPVILTFDMIGHYIGEFVLTRKRVEHSAPGIGATRSSAALSVK